MSDIDDLNEAVSRAIAEAEAMPTDRFRDTAEAWLQVAHLERRIAERTVASSVSGEAARIGAVRAAVQGWDLRLAHELATRYVADATLAERPRLELERLLSQVTRELDALTTGDPQILPVAARIAA